MTNTVRGELVDFRVRAADFWGIGTLRTTHDGGEVALVGKLIGCNAGDAIEVEGEFVTHPRYGKQFKIKTARVVLPSDTRGVVGWLAAKLPQISARRAEALVTEFGVEGLWATLDKGDPSPLCKIDGITAERAQAILDAYVTHKADRDRMVRFKQWGMTDNQVARVVDKWGDQAEAKLTEDPYDLITYVPGFGWERADAIALRMGIRRDEPARLAAALLHSMQVATQAGHCYCPGGKLIAITARDVAKISDEVALRRALTRLVERNKLVELDGHVYLPKIAAAEGELADELADRANGERWAAQNDPYAGGDVGDVGDDLDDLLDEPDEWLDSEPDNDNGEQR